MSQALAATSTTDIPWCIMGGSLCGSTFCPNVLWCWLDPSVHTIHVLWQPCQHFTEHIPKACHDPCVTVTLWSFLQHFSRANAAGYWHWCRYMKVGQTASKNKQACLAQGMTHYTHVKTKQDPWNMMGGGFYGATCVREDWKPPQSPLTTLKLYHCEFFKFGNLESGLWSRMDFCHFKVVPLWILLEIRSPGYAAGRIPTTLKLCHCKFFWISRVWLMQPDGFLPP